MSSWVKVATITMLAFGLAACGDRAADTQQSFQDGDRYFSEKNYNAAIIEYRNAIRQDEGFGLARYKLGQSYAALGDLPRARTELVRAADLLPENAEVQAAAGRMLLQVGQFEDARTRAERALKVDPKNVEAHLVRGAASAGMRDWDGALDAFQEGLGEASDQRQPDLYLSLGMLQAARGNRPEAEAAFKQAVAVAPTSTAARVALANYYWTTQRAAEAETELKKAVEIDPGHLLANRMLASLFLYTKRPADAEAPLKRAAEANDQPEPKLMLADYYLATNRIADAQAVLEKIATMPGAFVAATSRRAALEYRVGNRARGRAMLEEILAKEPRNGQVLVVKGRWSLQEGKLDEALAAANAATSADPQAWAAFELTGVVQAARRQPKEAIAALTECLKLNPRAFTAHLLLSDMHITEGNADAAVASAEEALRLRPTSSQARFGLARALFVKGDTARARFELRPLLDANAAPVHALNGQIALRQSDFATAKQAFERAAAIDPKSTDALAGLVRLDNAAKRPQDAARRIETFIKASPGDARAHFLAARTYEASGDGARAEASIRKAIELDPQYLEAYHFLANIFIRQQRMDAALQEYARLLQQRPNDLAGLTMVALLLQVQQKQGDAIKAYEKVLDVHPGAAVASNNLAYIYAMDGSNLDRALALAQTAKSELPDNPDVNDTLGWVYYKRNLPAQAVEFLEASAKVYRDNATVQYHLGMAYLQAGDKAKGRAALQKALALEPNFDGAAEARKALAAG